MSAVAFACDAKSSGGAYRRSSRRSVSIVFGSATSMSPYRLTVAGPGDSARETATGNGPQSGAPTGRTGLGDMPLTTPAADVYQATPAVTSPAQPPTWSQYGLMPCATRKNPIASKISV